MSSDYNQQIIAKESVASESNHHITFKDWKALKDSNNKTVEISQRKRKVKPTTNNKNGFYDNVNRNTYSCFDAPNAEEASDLFDKNSQPKINPARSFNTMNVSNTFGLQYYNFEPSDKCFHNFNYRNTIKRLNNFGGNISNRYTEHSTFTLPNRLSSDYRCNKYKETNDSSFTSDVAYRQKDMLQKNLNPFLEKQRDRPLLQEFDKYCHTKNQKTNRQVKAKTVSSSVNGNEKRTSSEINFCNEPKVYVPNPKAKIDGKPYIPKPKIPDKNLEITREEKKQQWKEYREAMKPFKNRDFYNAKRVVQRLGKKAPNELDEKQLIRLTNARQIMSAHKANLSAKYANYVKSEDSSNQLGQIYVIKKKSLNDIDFGKQTTK